MADMDRWEKTRTIGKLRFILVYGVVIWGLITAALYSVITYFWQHPEPWYSVFITSFIVFPVMGIVWGLLVWHFSEKKYLKSKS